MAFDSPQVINVMLSQELLNIMPPKPFDTLMNKLILKTVIIICLSISVYFLSLLRESSDYSRGPP